MAKHNNIPQRTITSAYIITTVSLTLVLFLLAMVGFLMLNASKLSNYVKENLSITIVINPTVEIDSIHNFQRSLDTISYIKSTRYVSSEEAAKEYIQKLGEDFIELLGYNPLYPSIEVHLYAKYADNIFIKKLEELLRKNELVFDVIYEKSLIHAVNENIKKISIVIFGFSVILFFIAISLINNNVRLLVYSKRFIIRTMQLVGATKNFIRKPFLWKSIFQGFISGFLANGMLICLIFYIQYELNELNWEINYFNLIPLFLIIFITGIFINLISTYFAINKYLRISTDNLYRL